MELIKQEFLDYLIAEAPELAESLFNAMHDYDLINSAQGENSNVSDNVDEKELLNPDYCDMKPYCDDRICEDNQACNYDTRIL